MDAQTANQGSIACREKAVVPYALVAKTAPTRLSHLLTVQAGHSAVKVQVNAVIVMMVTTVLLIALTAVSVRQLMNVQILHRHNSVLLELLAKVAQHSAQLVLKATTVHQVLLVVRSVLQAKTAQIQHRLPLQIVMLGPTV